MVLAEVKKPGLDAFLNNEFRQMSLNGAKETAAGGLDREAGDGAALRPRARCRTGAQKSGPMLIGVKDNLLAVTCNQAQMDDLGTRAGRNGSPGAAQDGLLGHVRDAYTNGAVWLLCVNMEQIARHTVNRNRWQRWPAAPAGTERHAGISSWNAKTSAARRKTRRP